MRSTFSLLLSAALLALAPASVSAQGCAEASRFGNYKLSSTSVPVGFSVTLTADFSCGISKGYLPAYVDYYLQSNQPVLHQGNILLARTEPGLQTASQVIDLVIPKANYDNSTYSLTVQYIYQATGPDGVSKYNALGGVQGPSLTLIQ